MKIYHMIDKNKTHGFTLIELLVVISIIGLLSSVVLASLNSARAKARDARRMSDFKQYELALEFYYDKYGGYPSDNFGGWEQPCKTTTNDIGKIVTEKFLPSLPCDPINTGSNLTGYGYFFDPNGAVVNGVMPQYCLWTNLEKGSSLKINKGNYSGC